MGHPELFTKWKRNTDIEAYKKQLYTRKEKTLQKKKINYYFIKLHWPKSIYYDTM